MLILLQQKSFLVEVEVHRYNLTLKCNYYQTCLEWGWGGEAQEMHVSNVHKHVEMVMMVLGNLCVTAEGQKMK